MSNKLVLQTVFSGILLCTLQCAHAQTVTWAGRSWKLTSGHMAGVAPGTPANVTFRNFAAITSLRVPIPPTANQGQTYSVAVSFASATSDGVNSPVFLTPMPATTILVTNVPYTVGDSASLHGAWYNAGTFGDNDLVNADVNIKGVLAIEHGGGPNTPALTTTIQGAGLTVGQLVIHDGQGDSTLNFGEITTGNNSWRLIINTNFKTCWTPINKLNSPTHFNGRDSLVSIPGDNISAIQQSTSHIMSCTRITYNHLIMRFKTLEGNILNTMTFMLRFCF